MEEDIDLEMHQVIELNRLIDEKYGDLTKEIIQSRARKSAEGIAKSIWGNGGLYGRGHSILVFEDIIARHFAEGEE